MTLAAGERTYVLPANPAAFREASVARQGEGWAARYDALLAAAATALIAGGAGCGGGCAHSGEDPTDTTAAHSSVGAFTAVPL